MDKILFWIIFFASLTRLIPRLPAFPDVFYYGSFLGCFIWIIFRGGIKMSWKYLFFLSAILFSIWLNDIPTFFRVWFRVIAFFSIVFLVGPFFMNDRLVCMRRLLFVRVLFALRWVVLISFFLNFIAPQLVIGRTGFSGLTNHSMLLSPVAGICALYGLYRFYLSETVLERYKEIVCTGISFLVLIMAGSRGALVATLVGVAFFYVRLYKHHMRRLVKVTVFLLLLAVSTSSIWWPYTERLRQKMESSEEAGSVTSTRDMMWRERIREFEAYPFFGVGFASFNMDYIQTEHTINRQTGTVEPGTSWLFLLSSLGLYGFLSFLLPVSYVLYILYKDSGTGLNGVLAGSLMALFFTHMLIEGYIISSGAFLCFFFWLLLSECEQILKKRNYKYSTI